VCKASKKFSIINYRIEIVGISYRLLGWSKNSCEVLQ
jgi:hypothetical protein